MTIVGDQHNNVLTVNDDENSHGLSSQPLVSASLRLPHQLQEHLLHPTSFFSVIFHLLLFFIKGHFTISIRPQAP